MAWTKETFTAVRPLAARLLDISISGMERSGHGMGYIWRGEPQIYSGVIPRLARRGNLRGATEADRLEAEIRWYEEWAECVASLVAPRDLKSPLREDGLPSIEWLNFAAHHGCPTRLVDWTASPWVALYFASCQAPSHAGRIWCFDGDELVKALHHQWDALAVPLASERSGNRDLTAAAFRPGGSDWICCQFNYAAPSRMDAQKGLFTITRRFDACHDQLIDVLVPDGAKFEFHIDALGLKEGLIGYLRSIGIDHETLRFPMIDQVGGTLQPPFRENAFLPCTKSSPRGHSRA